MFNLWFINMGTSILKQRYLAGEFNNKISVKKKVFFCYPGYRSNLYSKSNGNGCTLSLKQQHNLLHINLDRIKHSVFVMDLMEVVRFT
jgi:hypothetical protein